MAIPLKANNTVSRRRRRVPKNYRRHGSIRETSTTWRNVSAKVSSICCRCNRRGATRRARRSPSRSDADGSATSKASATGNFVNASRRSTNSLLSLFSRRRRRRRRRRRNPSRLPPPTPPNLTQSHPISPRSTIPFSPLFDTSTRFPETDEERDRCLEPCLIAYSRHLPKSRIY